MHDAGPIAASAQWSISMLSIQDVFNAASLSAFKSWFEISSNARVPDISFAECLGFASCAFVVLAFSVSSPLGLRVLAIASNVLFISYALTAGLRPIFLLHALLLPINSMHLAALFAKRRMAAAAEKRSNSDNACGVVSAIRPRLRPARHGGNRAYRTRSRVRECFSGD